MVLSKHLNRGREASDGAGVQASAEGRLRSSPYLALRELRCTYHEGVMTLRGCLPTYYLKQLARAVVAEVEGVHALDDQVEVLAPRRHESVGRDAVPHPGRRGSWGSNGIPDEGD